MTQEQSATMTRAEDVCRTLCESIGTRPVGTPANHAAVSYLLSLANQWDYEVTAVPFECLAWRYQESSFRPDRGEGSGLDPHRIPIHPGPFSPPLEGSFEVVVAGTLAELQEKEITDRLLIIRGPLGEEPLMPVDFPFYFPDEHREIIDLLQTRRPAGIVALTGRHPLCGLNPYPLFEDGNLGIPNGYTADAGERMPGRMEVELRSEPVPSTGRQLVFTRAGTSSRRVVVCAHMDTKYETPGALDNAAGIAVMMATMEKLNDSPLPWTIEFVPFNGEEYFGVPGQLAYLNLHGADSRPPDLVINIDGVGHRDSRSAVSLYNFDETDTARAIGIVEATDRVETGEPWVAGDHSMFAFQGIPCVAVTSSNLMETVVGLTHTTADVIGNVDFGLLESTAGFLVELLKMLTAAD